MSEDRTIRRSYLNQTTTVQTVTTRAAVLDGWYIDNPNGAMTYVQIFDTTTAPTLGTTVPDLALGVPANGAANLSRAGIVFTSGIRLAVTTTAGGLTGPGAGLNVNLWFRY